MKESFQTVRGGGWQTLFHEYSSCVTGTSCFQTFFKVAAKDWKEFQVGEEKKNPKSQSVNNSAAQQNSNGRAKFLSPTFDSWKQDTHGEIFPVHSALMDPKDGM